jgi:hypothetical protein
MWTLEHISLIWLPQKTTCFIWGAASIICITPNCPLTWGVLCVRTGGREKALTCLNYTANSTQADVPLLFWKVLAPRVMLLCSYANPSSLSPSRPLLPAIDSSSPTFSSFHHQHQILSQLPHMFSSLLQRFSLLSLIYFQSSWTSFSVLHHGCNVS